MQQVLNHTQRFGRLVRYMILALGVAMAIMILLFMVAIGIIVKEEYYSFSQPRDALRYAPTYSAVYADVQRYCDVSCSPEQFEPFFAARQRALQEDWPELLGVMLNSWRWHSHSFVEFSLGHALRDDFFATIDQIGGTEAARDCVPLVAWETVGNHFAHSFNGLRCGDSEYMFSF